MTQATIRRALAGDAPELSRIAFAAKAHWGYDAAFMERCRAELTISPEAAERQPTYLLELDGVIGGFYLLTLDGAAAELDYLYVLPELIGGGHGRRLFEHAAATARAAGCRSLGIQADPNAAPFYARMGAAKIAETPSGSIPGRMLPFLRLELSDAAAQG